MKHAFILVLLTFLLSCSKEEEEVIETGSVIVNFSIDLKGNTIGIFDVSSVQNFNIDIRKALKTQRILTNREEIKDLLPGNYVVLILEFDSIYLRATQIQKGKKSEVFL